MRNTFKTALLIMLILIPASLQASTGIREGLWEMTTTMQMPGAPAQMPPTTMKHCFTKEDVKDQKNVVTSKNKDCTVTDYKMSGNKVTWAMKCTGKSPGTFSGVTTFAGDSYSSTMQMQAQGMKMGMKLNAKRLGDCP